MDRCRSLCICVCGFFFRTCIYCNIFIQCSWIFMSCPLSSEAPQAECCRVAGMFDSKRFLASGPVLNWWEPSDSILNPLHFNCKFGFGSLFLGFSKMKFEGVYYHAFPRSFCNSFASRVLGDGFEARYVLLLLVSAYIVTVSSHSNLWYHAQKGVPTNQGTQKRVWSILTSKWILSPWIHDCCREIGIWQCPSRVLQVITSRWTGWNVLTRGETCRDLQAQFVAPVQEMCRGIPTGNPELPGATRSLRSHGWASLESAGMGPDPTCPTCV